MNEINFQMNVPNTESCNKTIRETIQNIKTDQKLLFKITFACNLTPLKHFMLQISPVA